MDAETRFNALFDEAYPALQRYARYRGLRGADADDLVAETLTVAWRRLGDVPRDDPTPWLFAVARNLWRNDRRRDSRRRRIARRLPVGSVESAEITETVEAGALAPDGVTGPAHRMRQALAGLPDIDQEILRLVVWDGLSPTQAGVVLGCTPGAARVRLHRARARLAGPAVRPAEHAGSRRARSGSDHPDPTGTDRSPHRRAAWRRGRPADRPSRPARRRGRRVSAGMVAAAAALALVVTVAGDRVGLDGPAPAVASIDDVVAASLEAMRGSGRATVSYDESWPDGTEITADGEVAFSGDDVDTMFRVQGSPTDPLDPAGTPRRETQSRLVDGELYHRTGGQGWSHDNMRDDGSVPVELFSVDPRGLLQALQPRAGFTLVGDEELDGRPVRHLRATAPEAVGDVDLGQGEIPAGTIEGLDVWVDEDDVIHRLDLAVTRNGRASRMVFVGPDEPCPEGSRPSDASVIEIRDGETTTQGRLCQVIEDPIPVAGAYSVRFHDLGTPVTITAPPDAVDMLPPED